MIAYVLHCDMYIYRQSAKEIAKTEKNLTSLHSLGRHSPFHTCSQDKQTVTSPQVRGLNSTIYHI